MTNLVRLKKLESANSLANEKKLESVVVVDVHVTFNGEFEHFKPRKDTIKNIAF